MHKVWAGGVLVGLVLAAGVVRAGDAEKPRLAVLMMDSRGSPLKADEVVGLTDLLAAEVAKTQHYHVLPRAEIRRRMAKNKAQEPLGGAPEWALGSSIHRVGSRCLTLVGLYHAGSAELRDAAHAQSPCQVDALLNTVTALAQKAAGFQGRSHQEPLLSMQVIQSAGTRLKADEVVGLTRLAENILAGGGSIRIAADDDVRRSLSQWTKLEPQRPGYAVGGKLGQVGKVCIGNLMLTDLHSRAKERRVPTLVNAVSSRGTCEADSLIDSVTRMADEMAQKLRRPEERTKGR